MVAMLLASLLLASPANSASAALADLQTVPPELRSQTRYLSLYNVPVDHRAQAATSVRYIVNAVSRSRLIVRPEVTSDRLLLRINLAAYADPKDPRSYPAVYAAWERLASVDPYYHLQTQVLVDGHIQDATVDGGWAGLDTAAALKILTGSAGAILRADWFVGQLATPPAYYEWAGIEPKEADFYRALGVDLDAINRLAADGAANMFRSQVTSRPRRVIYRPGPLGAVWLTKDASRETGDRDPIRNPVDYGAQRFKFDASEVIYARPNGMLGAVLYNAAGVRQDAVPANIATDTTAPAGHQELIPVISCLRCHESNGGQAGLQPFGDDQTKLPLPGSPYPEVTRRIAELYDPSRLDREMRRAREDYAAAVLNATDLTPAAAVKSLVATFETYAYQPVSPAVAAAEIGLSVEQLPQALAATADPILIRLRDGGQVNRKAWESSFQEAALCAQSFKRN